MAESVIVLAIPVILLFFILTRLMNEERREK